MIERVEIRNYRMFRKFGVNLAPDVNVFVGDNDAGKSTLLEAITLGLTGRLDGRVLQQELSPYHFNQEATLEYVTALSNGEHPAPPGIIIELYLSASVDTDLLRGTNNLLGADCCGVRLQVTLSRDYEREYQAFVTDPSSVRLIPIEYYHVEWLGFSGHAVTTRSIPASATVIDPTSIRLQSGTDYHLQQIIRTHLEPRERVELSRRYRSLREDFSQNEHVSRINDRLRDGDQMLTDRELSLSIDLSQRYTWESSLTAHVDQLPLQFAGKGEQNAVKTLLALGRRADGVQIVLVEEPENHMSFSSLRRLIQRIQEQCQGKQVVVTTHSAYVLNKLGLANLIVLGGGDGFRIDDLPPDTVDFFKKLPGFDTLRLVLAKSAILVEGPSDELVVQRAYRDEYGGRLPIDDGVDVISVGLSHKRFLDIAKRLGRPCRVVTDNDGHFDDTLARFVDYQSDENISIHIGIGDEHRTLEPQIAHANSLDVLNDVLATSFGSKEDIVDFMLKNKTEAALRIFESHSNLTMPEYIRDAIAGY